MGDGVKWLKRAPRYPHHWHLKENPAKLDAPCESKKLILSWACCVCEKSESIGQMLQYSTPKYGCIEHAYTFGICPAVAA